VRADVPAPRRHVSPALGAPARVRRGGLPLARSIRRIAALVAVAVAALAWWLWPPEGPPPRATAFTLSDVTVVQPGESRREHVALVVADGSIRELAVDAGHPSPASLVDLRGAFVLPGIIDMHAHLPSDTPLRLTELFGILYARYGVTSVRDAGDI